MIVMDDADLDLALEGVLWGAFGTTGQRCTATSRLILHRKVHDRFLRRLVDAARGLRLGDGREDGTDVGPLIHEASRDKVERYVEIGREQGAELVTGGSRAAGPTARRLVLPADRLRRRPPGQPAGAGGDLRAGAERGAGRLVRRSRAGQQRGALRPLEQRLHRRREPRLPGPAGARQRHHLRQRADDRGGGAPALRRREGRPATATARAAGKSSSSTRRRRSGYVDYSGKLQRAQIDTYDV